MKYRSLVLSLALMFLLVAGISCSSVDCPMNSLVYTQYAVCNADGSTATLQDTLTISTNRADGNDSVLINRDVNISGFSLPISYSMPEDSFFIALKDTRHLGGEQARPAPFRVARMCTRLLPQDYGRELHTPWH